MPFAVCGFIIAAASMDAQQETDMQLSADEVVRRIDATRETEHFRNPDRPDARTFKRTRRQPVEVVRVKGRLRTAAYRNRMDSERKPTTYQLGNALIVALATVDEWNPDEMRIVGRALADLHKRGFDVEAAKDCLRRIRAEYRGPMGS